MATLTHIKKVAKPSGKIYYYLARNEKQEDGSFTEKIIQPIPADEVAEREDGRLFWTKNPEYVQESVFKKLVAAFILRQVNMHGLPDELLFEPDEATVINDFIKDKVVPEYGRFFGQ